MADFMATASDYLSDDDERQSPGHNFWLTRNGHGAGFWNSDYINGDKLTELSKDFGPIDLYIGDDNKLYFF